jgi:hypothetical protein
MAKRTIVNTPADPTLPSTPIEIGGKLFNLCFDFGALAEAEADFNRQGHRVNLLTALPELNLGNTRILFAASVHKYHPELSFDEAIALVHFRNVYQVVQTISQAWNEAMPEVDEAEAKKRVGRKDARGILSPAEYRSLWTRNLALATIDLGLSEEQFYRLTPRKLSLLLKHRLLNRQLDEYMLAQLTAVTANFSMCRPKKSFTTQDFMLHPPERVAKSKKIPKKKKRELLSARIHRLFSLGAFGQVIYEDGNDRPSLPEADPTATVSASGCLTQG